jgi:hypothetical protein
LPEDRKILLKCSPPPHREATTLDKVTFTLQKEWPDKKEITVYVLKINFLFFSL